MTGVKPPSMERFAYGVAAVEVWEVKRRRRCCEEDWLVVMAPKVLGLIAVGQSSRGRLPSDHGTANRSIPGACSVEKGKMVRRTMLDYQLVCVARRWARGSEMPASAQSPWPRNRAASWRVLSSPRTSRMTIRPRNTETRPVAGSDKGV